VGFILFKVQNLIAGEIEKSGEAPTAGLSVCLSRSHNYQLQSPSFFPSSVSGFPVTSHLRLCTFHHIPMYKPPINLGTGSKLPECHECLTVASCNFLQLPTNSHPITDFFVKKTGSAIIV
jgi:hypothetical protein